VNQLIFNIKASRKVIIVLTSNYWQSHQGCYVLSAIENLYYQTGHDRAILVTFEENSLRLKGFLKARSKNNPWSVLQFPEDHKYYTIFWESLRNSLQ